MADLPYPPDDGQTHYECCYRYPHHHNCAVREVDKLTAQLAGLGEALQPFAEIYDPAIRGSFTGIALEDLRRARDVLTSLPDRAAKLLAVVEAAKGSVNAFEKYWKDTKDTTPEAAFVAGLREAKEIVRKHLGVHGQSSTADAIERVAREIESK